MKTIEKIFFVGICCLVVVIALAIGGAFSDPRYKQMEKAVSVEAVQAILNSNLDVPENLKKFAENRKDEIRHAEAEMLASLEPTDWQVWLKIGTLATAGSQLEAFADAQIEKFKQRKAEELAKTAKTFKEWRGVKDLAAYGTPSHKKAVEEMANLWHAEAEKLAEKAKTPKELYRVWRHAKDDSSLKKEFRAKFFKAQAKQLAGLTAEQLDLFRKSHEEGVSDEESSSLPNIDSHVMHAFQKMLQGTFSYLSN